MSTVDEYRKYARDCLRWANRALTEEQRKQFLNLAREWQQAASGLDGVQVPPQQVAPLQQDAAKTD
jgi:orotidine-5'-phosphate decarboxylase